MRDEALVPARFQQVVSGNACGVQEKADWVQCSVDSGAASAVEETKCYWRASHQKDVRGLLGVDNQTLYKWLRFRRRRS